MVKAYAELHLQDDWGGAIRPAAHHDLWLELLCDWSIPRLLIIAPPEAAKTTWVLSAYAGCRIGMYPEQSVIIGSAAGDIAEKRSISLRTMVQSQAWQETFPEVKPVQHSRAMKWSPMEWSLAPNGVPTLGRLHHTVSSYGPGGSVIGSRANEVIGDDILSFENSRTAHQREVIENFAHTSLYSRIKSGIGRIILIGTTWHPDDLYAKARRMGTWVVCHVPLLNEPGDDGFYARLEYPDGHTGRRLGEPVSTLEADR